MRLRPPLALAAAALLAAGLAACGEKEEPSAAELRASSSEEQFAEKLPIVGDWRGELRQKGLKPFTVTAKISGSEGPNTVHYSGIDCSGRWTYQGRAGDEYVFGERIDAGQGGECKGSGTVTLVLVADDRLSYEFQGGGVESQGTLQRVG
jgi:hypothetical protein